MSTKKIASLTLFLVFVMGIGGVYLWNQSRSASQVQQEQPHTPTRAFPSVTQQPSPSEEGQNVPDGWSTYTDETHDFAIAYPQDWRVNDGGQMFQSGDVFSVTKWGPTQGEGTELHDGARIAVMMPIEADVSADEWIRQQYGETTEVSGEPVEYSTESFGDIEYEHAYMCGLGCFDYYHVKNNSSMYGIVVIAAGENEEEYRQVAEQMLASFRFLEE